jgi:hypothetical protein
MSDSKPELQTSRLMVGSRNTCALLQGPFQGSIVCHVNNAVLSQGMQPVPS